eukprot:9692151-Ditylum_brightwellii.AAC.1
MGHGCIKRAKETMLSTRSTSLRHTSLRILFALLTVFCIVTNCTTIDEETTTTTTADGDVAATLKKEAMESFELLRKAVESEAGGYVHPSLGLLIPAPCGADRGLGVTTVQGAEDINDNNDV